MASTTGETRRVTSADVAREAGLSRATVSYVLNRDPRQTIPEATRQRVLDAAERLHYRPFGPARLLRGARSTLVLMLSPGIQQASDLVAGTIVAELGQKLRDKGLHLVWQLGSEDISESADLFPAVVLSSTDEGDPLLDELRRAYSCPVLPAFPGLDDFIASAAQAQVKHLAGRGKRRIMFASPERPELQPTAQLRWQAVVTESAALGLRPPVLVGVGSDLGAVKNALTIVLRDEPDVDAVCAYNDETAFAVLAAAHAAGIAVPDRLAVVGVDNHPFSPFAIPPLSTVSSDVEGYAHQLAEQVVRVAAGNNTEPICLPMADRMVARASA